MDENVIEKIDRISQLPDFIVHHILSFLDSPDLVKTSVLSKKWFTLWASFPLLKFDFLTIASSMETRLMDPQSMDECYEKLIKYVGYTMSKFSEHNLSAHTFKLAAKIRLIREAALVDQWISLAVEKHVRVLDISDVGINYYRLPNTILSATSLTTLKLQGCVLPYALLVNGIGLRSLKSLYLADMQIDDQVFKYLTTICPLIEEFGVHRCDGYKNISITGLQNLQRVEVGFSHEVETIDIEALNLTYFDLRIPNRKNLQCINLAWCKNLRTLSLAMRSLRTTWFSEFISNFPLLENVYLSMCFFEEKFKVSSHSLRKFRLGRCCSYMEEIEIDAPNLLSFCYYGVMESTHFHLTSISAKCKAIIWGDVDILVFYKLRLFLHKTNRFKILELPLDCDEFVSATNFVESNVDKLEIPPYELEHLVLKIPPPWAYPAVVDAVFWCCRPQSLTVVLTDWLLEFEEHINYVKYVYEKLLQQGNLCHREIQIMVTGGSVATKVFINIDSLLDAFPGLQEDQEILFRTTRNQTTKRKLKGSRTPCKNVFRKLERIIHRYETQN